MSIEKEINNTNLSTEKSQEYIKILSNFDNTLKYLNKEQSAKYFEILAEINQLNLEKEKEFTYLYNGLVGAFLYLKSDGSIDLSLTFQTFMEEYQLLWNIIKLYKVRRDFPNPIRKNLHDFLFALPQFNEAAPVQSDETIKDAQIKNSNSNGLFKKYRFCKITSK